MAVRTGEPAPYAPPANVLQIIHGFRDRGLATPFTPEVLVRAGITESLVPRTLRALEALDLIDADGNPTAEMRGLREAPTDEFKSRLQSVVQSAYAEVLQFADPAKDSPTKIVDAFRSYEPAGQRGRMVTLFLGLCEAAGIIPEGGARKQAPGGVGKKASPRASRKAKPSPPPATRAPTRTSTAPLEHTDGLDVSIRGLIAKIPTNGTGWTQVERDRWMAAFQTVLDYAVPIRDEADEPDEIDDDE